ncbi:MAG TPA: hypothetical protein VFX47_06780 [Gammaproteobacteria bacterium]|nr:hypothetical protein [Gammaproteobacteria bacterium]
MTANEMNLRQDDPLDAKRRRARRTAWIFGILALAFYAGIFCLMHWRHLLS